MGNISRIIVLLLFGALATDAARADGWTQDAYVWQRQQSPALDAALRDSRGHVRAYCVLASEISWREDSPQITRPRLDFAGLASLEKPIGLALRIGTVTVEKQFVAALPRIAAEASALLETARAAGLNPSELQIDFDCPESKLALYRDWLATLKTVAGETPLVFTALPCWLDHEDAFVALARESGGFVLQVHSLAKPEGIASPFTLCDPEEALRRTRQASVLAKRARATFRIALPTYGYTLGFDAGGRFIGLAAETPRDWPADAQLRTVRADPRAMQALAQKLAVEKPPRATGVIWFRLPVAGDRLAWSAETFFAVIENRPIESRLAVEINRAQPGLAEIVIVNRGQTVESLPEELRVTWAAGFQPVSWDGIGGYRFHSAFSDSRDHILRISRAPGHAEIAPGRRRAAGWVRFDFSKTTTDDTKSFFIHATIP